MAIYRLSAQMISRGKGQSAVASVAYRSSEKLKDERLGMSFDYSGKRDVVHTEIMAPDIENPPSWISDREKLWNEVEAVEKRKDSQIAREIQLSLPEELDLEKQIELTRAFVQKTYVDHGVVADVCIHNKPGNPHAHVMLTTRTLTPEGFSKAKFTEFNRKDALMEWRESWAEYANYHLAKAGHDIQIDHRSYADQGLDLEPQNKIGAGIHMGDHSALQRFADHQRIAKENGDRIIVDPNIALDAISRQQAVFTEYDIYRLAHRQSVDALQYREVSKAIMESKELVKLGPHKDGRDRFTTVKTLEIEKEMLANGMDMAAHGRHPVERRFLRQARAVRTLTPDQDKAFEHIMKSGDLCCVVGYAGSGKSYTLGAVREAYEARGYRVMGTALAGIAAEGLERESGMESRTIARLLIDIENNQERLTERDVLVVDEAGMTATRQMARLIEQAHQGRAKVILVGSGQQLQPIEAGGPFRSFYHRLGAAEMTGIRRQEIDWQKECTKQLEGNQAGRALETYKDHGRIYEHKTINDAIDGIVEEWRKAQAQGSCVAVAFRNVDVDEINQRIRDKAKEIGRLKGGEREFQTIKGKRMFAPGDRVLFLKNDPRIGVKNGNFGEVERIRRSKIQVRRDDGSRIAFDVKDYIHINHGYAATTHKLQGATVDRTVVLAAPYFDRHATLVALSRHRADVSMHWSKETFKDFDRLKATLTRDRPKELAHDFRKEIHGHRKTRDDLLRELDSGPNRTSGGHTGRLGRRNPPSHAIARTGDRTPEPRSRTSAERERASSASMESESGRYDSKSSQRRQWAEVEVYYDVHGGRHSRRNDSAVRIRAYGVQVLRHRRTYETYRRELEQAAAGRSTDLRREVTERVHDKGEIERFKSEINLVEYAQANGYTLERRESSRNSKIMSHENGDRIVVGTTKEGHGVYCSLKDNRDNGSIVDFVQSRRDMDLRESRRELRPWIGMGRMPERPLMPEQKPLPSSDLSIHQMTADFSITKTVERQTYLENCGISKSTLADDRFRGMVREDDNGNVVFPHYTHGGLTGYEINNEDFKGFSEGGSRGVWVTNNVSSAKEIVVTQSAMDALSHAQMRETDKDTAYISVGGTISRHQERLISSLMDRAHHRGARISIATGMDEPGHKLAWSLKEMAPKEASVKRMIPRQGNDFSECLQIRTQEHSMDRTMERGFDMDRGMER